VAVFYPVFCDCWMCIGIPVNIVSVFYNSRFPIVIPFVPHKKLRDLCRIFYKHTFLVFNIGRVSLCPRMMFPNLLRLKYEIFVSKSIIAVLILSEILGMYGSVNQCDTESLFFPLSIITFLFFVEWYFSLLWTISNINFNG